MEKIYRFIAMFGIFKKEANNYTLYGALFGFAFPVFSSLFDAWMNFGNCWPSSIIAVQLSTPLHWVINSAPLWLGLFSRFVGIRQDQLNENINVMRLINKDLEAEIEKRKEVEAQLRKKNEVMEDDLDAARAVQLSFLPEIPDVSFLAIDYQYTPLKAVGGDLLSLIKLNEKQLGLFIGDVTGHGVKASLYTSLVKVISDRMSLLYGLDPKTYLEHLNKELINMMPEESFLTALYGFFLRQGDEVLLSYSRAAHPYPIVWRSAHGEAELLKSGGVPICYDDDSTFVNNPVSLRQGDRIFFYTDGFHESRNRSKEMLDFAGLQRLIKEINNRGLSLGETTDAIIKEVEVFTEGLPVTDDRVLIGVEVTL
ncbi:MAG: SpoIIE family protein phosphatase [bacterium]|nr:SpoIIE family protein phosphatase [bacterium]